VCAWLDERQAAVAQMAEDLKCHTPPSDEMAGFLPRHDARRTASGDPAGEAVRLESVPGPGIRRLTGHRTLLQSNRSPAGSPTQFAVIMPRRIPAISSGCAGYGYLRYLGHLCERAALALITSAHRLAAPRGIQRAALQSDAQRLRGAPGHERCGADDRA